MRELAVELKQLRMHGMAGTWADLVEQGGSAALDSSRWLLEHLLQAETTDRAMRSVSHQMHTAKFPVHRDLAGFVISASVWINLRSTGETSKSKPARSRWTGNFAECI